MMQFPGTIFDWKHYFYIGKYYKPTSWDLGEGLVQTDSIVPIYDEFPLVDQGAQWGEIWYKEDEKLHQ